MRRIIVSRHPATVAFIQRQAPEFADAPVFAMANADDVRGAIVAGNLPLRLAALADQVIAVEFDGVPPRGTEYDLTDMEAAGARLAAYSVFPGGDTCCVISVGNPYDGLRLWGPFGDTDAANDYADAHFHGEEWHVVCLHAAR